MATAKKEKRNSEIRRMFGLAKKGGIDEDLLRDIVKEVTGVMNPETGTGSISRLNQKQRRQVISHLEGSSGGKRRRGWAMASDKQIKYINDLHGRLKEAGELENPMGFFKSITGRDSLERLPRIGKRSVSAQGYLEVLIDKCKKAGIYSPK